MSSIKKYVGGDKKDWVKFGETNVYPNDLSNANNISVDFGGCESVNSLLYSQQRDIEALKRNVSWLALHGGGGSGGSGGGGGGNVRKASCQITINDTTKEVSVSVSEGQTIYVRLINFKGSSTTVPWNIKITFDDQSVYTGSKVQGTYDAITVPIAWSMVSRFFDGTGKLKNHLMTIQATYKDDETQLEGSGSLEAYVYIPTITVKLTAKDQYNISDSPSELTASIAIDTALKGKFKLRVQSTSYNKSLDYDSFEFNKTTDSATFQIDNFIDAFKEEGEPQFGVFSSTFLLYNENATTGALQLVYQTTKQVVVFSNAVDLLVSFDGLSPDSESRTEVYDNVKNLFFSFYAFKNGSTEFKYTILLKDETDDTQPDIEVIKDKTAAFQTVITINKIVDQFITDHDYKAIIQITPTRPAGDMKEFYGFVKCIQGQYAFITYSNDGELNRLFMLDSFNPVLNNSGISPEVTITATSTDESKEGDGHPISTNLSFAQINPRSGLIANDDNMKALRLYDTYMDIANDFKYTVEEGGVLKVTSTNVQNQQQFTICLCYQTQSYTSNDHVVFALCNNGFTNQGIAVKNDGVYVKGSKVLTVYGNKVVTLHIVYNNERGTATKWGDKSCYKIYVNGVITFMSDKCPFQEAGDDKIIQNSNLKISVNGYSNTESANRQEQCNCNIYNIEIIKSVMNEIDILGSYVNNKIRTTYKDFSPDFDILNTELVKNCCTYDVTNHVITSDMYPTSGAERKFVFKGVLLDSLGEVPQTNDTDEKQRWIAKLSSLSLPITYIDLKGSSSPQLTAWTFKNFILPGDQLKNTAVASKFYYWDPKTNEMPISSDSVEVKTQGTSTQEDYIKNLEIKFSSYEQSGKIVQDLFFVKNDWIPENSYILKADVVDSSHANNASIGKFINDQFFKDNSFGFGFDDKGIASKNITQTSGALKDTQGWNINPALKHTVEGFQTLLLVRFAEGDFRNLGIYSFNIGRNAARNLGFEYITGITDTKGVPVAGAVAPSILKNVIVDTANEDQIFWVENSNSQNFDGISAWTPSTTTITPDPEGVKTGANPEYSCRFWHCQQGTVEDDTKLNQLFETKYHNTVEDVYPARINTFNNFVKQISQLPVEGLLRTTALDQSFPQVTGGYATYKYTDISGWTKLSATHILNAEPLEASDVNTFDPTQMASYYVIALMFGLIDNLDKNISFRVFGDAKILADFYDMDTALGLNNVGLEDVTPTVGMKLVTNYRNTLNQDYPQETFNQEEVKDMYKKYSKFLPETYSNKLWLSLDSNSMRTFNGINYSLYSSLWFKLRQYLDTIAKSEGYTSVVDFFVDKYFGNQVNCGTFIYNYDYTMKYLNDYEQTGQKQTQNTISKLHGRRIDEVREWLKNHIDFLDSYFYWRGKYTFVNGSKVIPSGLETVVTKKVSITSSSNNSQIEIETEHPVVVHSSSTADGDEVGDTLTIEDVPQNIKVSGGGTDKAMALNCSSLLKNFDLVSLGAKKFRAQDGSKITFLEELILDGLTIVADGISMDDFVDETSQDVNVLTKISMNKTKFAQSFDLDLNKFQFLNVSYVDIKDSTNIHSLSFYKSGFASDTTTQNLKYLNVEGSQIENLTLKNQSYLVLPKIDTCNNLVTLTYENCNLDNISGSRTAVSNYVDIDLSVQNSIQTVTLKNVEQVKSIRINECPQFQELNVEGLSSLTSLTLGSDLKLNKINIIDCPKLKTIKITHCSAFSEIEILSASSLTSLNLEYDVALTALKISEDSVKNISNINLRNVDISGFNFYNYGTKSYDPIIKDPLGHEVLDFSKFESLDSSGITIRRNSNGDLTQDKCSNFLAYRFPNTPGKFYYALDRNRDDVGVRFTNLKNIYGHIGIRSNSDFSSMTDLFLNSGEYKGYPPFLTKVIPNGAVGINSALLRTSTLLDNIEERCPTLGLKLRNMKSLNGISPYIKNGFLSCTEDGVEEFDSREWATNYTVTTLSYVLEGSRRLTELPFQYFIYRYSMYERNAQPAGTVNNIHGFANYAPSNIIAGQHIRIPENTFRFIGNTITDLRRFFGWANNMPTGSNYIVDKATMQHFTKISTYGGIGSREIMFWDALSAQTQLTALGNVDNGSYYTANFTKALSGEDDGGEPYDYGPAFLSTLVNLKKVMYFQPDVTNFHLSGCNLPASVEELGNSFTKFDTSEIIDLSALFNGCSNMKKLYNSFNTAQLIVKPSTFKQMPAIEQILFNNAKKILVEDRVTLNNYLDSYDEDAGRYQVRDSYSPVPSPDATTYTSDMFLQFIRNALTANTQLTSTDYLLANMTIPYKNIYENDYTALPLHKDLLKNNKRLESLQNFFKGQNFRYSLVPEMFSTLTAITNMYAAFANTPSLARGVDSCIPFKFLYTGQPTTKSQTVQFTGSDRFDAPPASYADFMTIVKNSYVPTQAAEGQTSYGWNDLSTGLKSSGLLDSAAFDDVKAAYHLTGDSYVDLPNNLNDYKDVCPLVTCRIIGGEPTYEVTPGGEPLVRTLSTIHSNMSSDTSAWKQHVCGIQTQTHQYPLYNRTIANINYILSGNACLKPYNGSIVTERNAEYNPYKLNYSEERQMLSVNNNRNTFIYDDQWSNNGAIWKWSDDADDWVIDESNYKSGHFNSSTPDMRVLSSNNEQVHDLSGTGMEIIYDGVDQFKRATFNNHETKPIDLVEYLLFKDQVQEFKYICPPDMFRYLNADTMVLNYIFARCDNFCNSGSVDYDTNKKNLNIGLTGRIPPNLFKPVKNLKDITGMFRQCYHITGYESTNEEGDICTYLIPAQLFENAPTVNCFNEAFYGTSIKYAPDFKTPLNKITAGGSSNGVKLQMKHMFAYCIWCNVERPITQLFQGKYFSNIDYAFLNTLGTGTSTPSNVRRIVNNGATIGAIPNFNIFSLKKFVPTAITQTYYGSIYGASHIYTVDSKDVARRTLTESATIAPSDPE